MSDNKELAVTTGSTFLAPTTDLDTIYRVYQAKKEFIEHIMHKDVDYGTIPGSEKPALLKPGAEKLNSLFSLYPTFDHVEMVKDWTGKEHGGEPFFHYHERANLWRQSGEVRFLVASADGSCNSWEKKYRYRQQERTCPACGNSTIIKGKEEYGGGWLCYHKKGGCGAKFKDGDQTIESQQLGMVKNPDVADLDNTILKMAQKRALVAATLIATGASDYFTQDIDDFIEGEFKAVSTEPKLEKPAAQTKKAQTPKPAPKSDASKNGGTNLPQQLVDAGLFDTIQAAANICNRLDLAKVPYEEAEKMARGYRGWRDMSASTDQAVKYIKNNDYPK